MKITGYEATILNVPEDDPLANMPEEAGRTRPIVILRLRTDAGIEGIGVTLYGGAMTGTPAQRGRGARRADRRRGPAAHRGDRRQAAQRRPAMPAGRAASSPWRCRRSTSRCGTSRARRWTSRCGSCSAAIATGSPTYASGSLRRGLTRRPGAARPRASLVEKGFREMKTQMALPGDPSPAEEVAPRARGARGDRPRHQADVRHQPALAGRAGDRHRPAASRMSACSGSRT